MSLNIMAHQMMFQAQVMNVNHQKKTKYRPQLVWHYGMYITVALMIAMIKIIARTGETHGTARIPQPAI